mgnify:CR=1 FL=1|tara:strand:+ start:237 stop:467 length:231 start_codon:yes stop_codon:yes gene_type:complete
MNISLEIDRLKQRIDELEKKAHTPREFIRCEECKTQVKEKVNASNNSVHNKDIPNGKNVKKSSNSSGRLPSSKLKK